MKKILFTIMIALTCGFVLTSCKQKTANTVVDLHTQEGFGPFMPGQLIVGPAHQELIYTNVPEEIEEYVVRSRIIEPEQEVLFLIGTKGDKRVIIVDTNGDKDFGNEEILEYDYPLSLAEQKKIEDSLPTVSMQFECTENGESFTKHVNIKPSPYLGSLSLIFNTDNEVEKKYYLFVSIYEYKQGEITINGEDFKVCVSNGFTCLNYLKERVSVFIKPKTDTMLTELEGNIPYIIGDIINIKGYDYSIDSISNQGDKLFIGYRGKNLRPEGISEGYYLPKFEAVYLDYTTFDLSEYSGKYVLLDFWGTWCMPCIKFIPELKELNAEFSNKNFALISIAYDDSPEKVMNFVTQEEMDWSHLFVNANQQDENSVIEKLKVNRFPTTILVSPDRKIIGRDLSIEQLRKLLIENTYIN